MIPLLAPICLLVGLDKPEPTARFAFCPETKVHIAVQPNKDHYLVHFHLLVENCADKTVFARVRTLQKIGERERQHLDTKEVPIEKAKETWSFYLTAPRFAADAQRDVIYQIEVGYKDSANIDEYRILDSFGWRIAKGKMDAGTKDVAVSIQVPARVVQIKGESFTIRTVAQTAVKTVGLKYNIVNNLPEVVDGSRAARKIE